MLAARMVPTTVLDQSGMTPSSADLTCVNAADGAEFMLKGFARSPRSGKRQGKARKQKDNHMRRRLLILGGAIFLAVGGTIGEEIVSSSTPACAASEKVSFKDDVMPIFVGHCFSCHKPGGLGDEKSGLNLSTYAGVMKGTKSGKMVIPGDPESSNLMWLLDWRGAPETHMPLGKKKLSTCDRDVIREWIREGAKDN
jgi:Planctomycete cytochrome C